MFRPIRFSIVHEYDRSWELRKDGTARVLIRAYLNRRCKYFNTGVYVSPKQWDNKTRRVTRHSHQAKLNQSIRKQLESMEVFVLTLQDNKEPISLERLGDYRSYKPISSFTDFFQKQLQNSGVSKDTLRDQRQTFLKLKEFQSKIYFHQLDFRLIHGFEEFLRSEKRLSANTIAKHHKNLKKYINLAIRYGYLDVNKNPYLSIKVRKEPTERVYLTEDELSRVEAVVIPKDKEYLQLIKDTFLFSCYTGLRYSDISRITKENISETPAGIELYLRAKKTKKPYHQNLRKLFGGKNREESKPEKIIQRRLKAHLEFFGTHPAYENEPLFNLSNPYLNRELKTLAKLCKLRKLAREKISIHSGRHTFGSIMAGKVPLPILQQLMQHSNVKETMKYVHMNRKAMEMILDNIDW